MQHAAVQPNQTQSILSVLTRIDGLIYGRSAPPFPPPIIHKGPFKSHPNVIIIDACFLGGQGAGKDVFGLRECSLMKAFYEILISAQQNDARGGRVGWGW